MSESLATWLLAQEAALCGAVLRRAPNLLPDEDDLAGFLTVVREGLDDAGSRQLSRIQSWAVQTLGSDEALARDWVTLLRLAKETVGSWLLRDSSPEAALESWQRLDRPFTHALVEVSRLAGSSDYSTMLSYMEDLKRQVEVLERSKANFITVAAHELRTPLTILEGYASMVRNQVPADDQQVHLMLDGMNNGIRRLKAIIGDMIDVTMIDSQALSISFQPLNLDKIVRMAADNLADAFTEREVRLEVFSLPVDGPIYADPSRLFQALTKLLRNGLKYTPDGGAVRVSGQLTRQDEQSEDVAGYIDIQIADTGIGIPVDQLEAIFEKFGGFRDAALHSSGQTRFKAGGPGLGLQIVRGIVAAHGGRVWAESEGLDEQRCPGSTFHVELPIRRRPPGD